MQSDEQVLRRLHVAADKFVKAVEKKFSVQLDFSEASVYAVDTLISLFFKERRPYNLAVTLIGGFLGEILIQNLGGEWDTKTLVIEKIGPMKGVAYPFQQVRLRLEKGLGKSLSSWYARLKMDFCHNGEIDWNGKISNGLSNALLAEHWDSRLMERILCDKEKLQIREEAAMVLARLKSARVAPVLTQWLEHSERAYYACIAFQGIPEPSALPGLRHLCSDGAEMAIRIQAIQAIGEQRDRDSIEMLFDLLHDPQEVINHCASAALAKIGGELVLRGLLDILDDKRVGNKVCAISALELLGDRVCVPHLLQNLFHAKEAIREASVKAFQYLPDSRALKPLLLLLKDDSSRLRILAAYALVFLGDAQALDPLRELLKDSVKDVREHASYLVPLLEAGKRPAGFCW